MLRKIRIQPDIVVLGKALTAGYLPLSATVVSPRIGQLYSRETKQVGFMHGHTFSGNPLACSAALANLEVLESDGFVQQLQETMTYFAQKMPVGLLHPNIGEIRHRGFFAGVELFNPKRKVDWSKIALDVCNESKRNGVLIRPLGNTLVLAPPYISRSEDIDLLIETTNQAIHAVSNTYGI